MVCFIMLAGWSKFKGWKVLEFFLGNSMPVHVKGLARILKISSATAQHYLCEYEKEGVLEKERIGNLTNYRLKESPLILELKKVFFLSLLGGFAKEFSKENPAVSALVLYGSHAKGSFDEKSDIDLLALSQNKNVFSKKAIEKLEKKTGKEIKIQFFTVGEWSHLLGKKDNFAVSVLKNHVVLLGEGF